MRLILTLVDNWSVADSKSQVLARFQPLTGLIRKQRACLKYAACPTSGLTRFKQSSSCCEGSRFLSGQQQPAG